MHKRAITKRLHLLWHSGMRVVRLAANKQHGTQVRRGASCITEKMQRGTTHWLPRPELSHQLAQHPAPPFQRTSQLWAKLPVAFGFLVEDWP